MYFILVIFLISNFGPFVVRVVVKFIEDVYNWFKAVSDDLSTARIQRQRVAVEAAAQAVNPPPNNFREPLRANYPPLNNYNMQHQVVNQQPNMFTMPHATANPVPNTLPPNAGSSSSTDTFQPGDNEQNQRPTHGLNNRARHNRANGL